MAAYRSVAEGVPVMADDIFNIVSDIENMGPGDVAGAYDPASGYAPIDLYGVEEIPATQIWFLLHQARREILQHASLDPLFSTDASMRDILSDEVLSELVAIALMETSRGEGEMAKPMLVNDESGATGLFQFLRGTWEEMSGTGPQEDWPGPFGTSVEGLVEGITPENDPRLDPLQSARAALMMWYWDTQRLDTDPRVRYQGHPNHPTAPWWAANNWDTAFATAQNAYSDAQGILQSPAPGMFSFTMSEPNTGTVTGSFDDALGAATGPVSDDGTGGGTPFTFETEGTLYRARNQQGRFDYYYTLDIGGATVSWSLGPADWLPTTERQAAELITAPDSSWIQSTGQVTAGNFRNGQFYVLDPDADDGYLSIQEVTNQLIMHAGLPDDALNDAGIQTILAQVVADPTLLGAPEEIAWRVDQTDWGKVRSDKIKAWDSSNEGQREDLIEFALYGSDGTGGILGQWKKYTSIMATPSMDQMMVGGHSMNDWGRLVASGQKTYWQALEAIKDYATDLAERTGQDNTWTIHVRNQKILGGQWNMDLENKVQELEEIYATWGLNPQNHSWDLKNQARELLENEISMSEIMDSVRETAKEKFPGKPEFVNTTDYAMPWVNMWDQEMPTPIAGSGGKGALENADIMTALQEGENPLDFRTRLRGKDEWKKSKRAKEISADVMRNVSDTFGFSGGGGIF